jgi:membrane associated rhomboid family serine protease
LGEETGAFRIENPVQSAYVAPAMIGDRQYMRDEPRFSQRSTTLYLVLGLVGVFALQQVNDVYVGWNLGRILGLSPAGLGRGHLWQLFTFQFLHAGLLHLICNLIGLWFLGRAVEERLGSRALLKIYFAGGFLGGVLQVALGAAFPAYFGIRSVVGASAGVCALLATFCRIEPRAVVLIFFVLPLQAAQVLYISIGIALFFIIVPSDPGVAHGAHLGGLLLGMAFVRWNLNALDPLATLRRLRTQKPRRALVKTAASVRSGWQKPEPAPVLDDLPPGEFISREVDPILDKISAHGIQSLTARERRILEQARSKMSNR